MISDKQNNAASAASGHRSDPSFTPRPRADRETGDRFARSLQDREKQEASNDKSEEKKLLGEDEGLSGLHRRSDDASGGSAGNAGDQVGLRQVDFAKATAQASMAGEALPAHLEKMAAAIQEMAAKGIEAKFHLQLPLGTLTVQTATLGRDATGNLAVQLQALGVMSPAQMSRLSTDLANRLRLRNLRVGSVEFSQASPTQAQQAPADSRQTIG